MRIEIVTNSTQETEAAGTALARSLMAGAVLVGAYGIAWLGLVERLVYGRGREDRVLWEWLSQSHDMKWPEAWQVAVLLVLAMGGKLWIQDMPPRREGSMGWLAGFLGALVVFVWMVRVPWQTPVALMIPVMLGFGVTWMAGAAILRYFWMPVVMTLAIVPPGLLLVVWPQFRRGIYRIMEPWYDGVFEIPLNRVPARQMNWVGALPGPVLTLMGAALFCWVVKGRVWLKVPVSLTAAAHLVLDVCFNSDGC